MEIASPTRQFQHQKHQLLVIFGFSLLTLVTSQLVTHFIDINHLLVQVQLRAFIEILSPVIGAIFAYLLLELETLNEGSSFNIPIALALAAMCFLDILYSLQESGSAALILSSFANFLGGLFFLAILLPAAILKKSWFTTFFSYLVLITMSMVGCLTILFPDFIPTLTPSGNVHAITYLLNLSGTVFALFASIKLYLSFRTTAKILDLYLALLCAQFAIISALIDYSTKWDSAWWAMHVVHFVTYATGLWLIKELIKLTLTNKSIVEIKTSKKLIRENDALLATLNDHAIISIANRAGNIVEVNDAFCTISGYSRFELIGKNHRVVNSGTHEASFWAGMWADISNGRPWRGEVCNRAKNGRLYWVDTVITPMMDERGNIEKYISIRSDISASKKTARNLESALRDSHALQTTLNLHSIISIADRAGNIIEVNDAFCAISGFSREELLGKNHRIVNSGIQDGKFWQTMWATISSGQPWRGEVCNRAKDGSLYWVYTVISPFVDKDGRIEKYISIRTDISASKKLALNLERALRESEALLTTLNLHAIVSMANRAGNIIEVNDAFCHISGYTRGELIGQNHRIVNSGMHPPSFWEEMWMSISVGMSWRGQVCNRAKNGSLYWVDTFVAPFMGEYEQIEKYISIRTDITASKLAEDALRWNESLMQLMSNSSPLAFLVVDNRNDRVLYFNQRFCEIWGIENLAAGMRSGEIKHREMLASCLPVLANPEAYLSSCIPLNDENNLAVIEDEIDFISHRAVRRFSTQIRDSLGKYYGRFYIYEEVTERKQVQAALSAATASAQTALEALKISEERINFAIEGSGDGVWDWNISTGKVLLSKRWKELLGHQENEIGEDISEWSSRLHPDEAAQVLAALQHNLNGEESYYSQEHRMLCKDGSYIWILSRGMVVQRDAQGMPLRMVGTHTDISTQKNAEFTLTLASETALATSVAKGQFLANISHELRTPMNAILGMLTLLRKTDLTAKQLDYTVKSDTAARSLLNLLNEILDFSKVEAGKMELDCHPFSLEPLLSNLSAILTANLGSKPLEIVFDIDPAIPSSLLGDSMRLQQVLINLTNNAIKFTDVGEVLIKLAVTSKTANQATLLFAIRDTGIGIALENQASIFNGFTQAEASTTRRYGGTGLGLAISQHLVELMGSKIELQSTLGEGSLFYFSITLPIVAGDIAVLSQLPLYQSPAPAVPSIDIVQSISATKEDASRLNTSSLYADTLTGQRLLDMRILVAEDNFTNQQVISELLRSEGAIIELANNGQEAIDKLLVTPMAFDVVLMDLQMPVMDGFTATTQIRSVLKLRALPIIAMTANAMSSDREACLAAGMNNHVGKPFNFNHLVSVLRKHTGRSAYIEDEIQLAARTAQSASLLSPEIMAAANNACVDMHTALNRLDNKVDVYLRMLSSFYADLEILPKQLKQQIRDGEFEEFQRNMHNLKGVSSTLGIHTLTAEASWAQVQFANNVSVQQAISIEQHVSLTIEQLCPALIELLETLQRREQLSSDRGPNHEPDHSGFLLSLQRMAMQLTNSDMCAIETMKELRRQSEQLHLTKLAQIDDAINKLNFSYAAQLCNALLKNLVEKTLK